MMSSVLTWRSRDGDLGGWLEAMVRRFGASPGRFQIQRHSPITRHFCAGNSCHCPREIDNTYVATPQALASQLLSEAVDTVTFTASTPDHWSLRAVSDSRSRLASVRVFMPRAAAWPLPAELSDTADLYRLLTGLATLLRLPQPVSAPADPVRYPRPIRLDGTGADVPSATINGYPTTTPRWSSGR